jgi:PTH1 family peptidyl-tRNA hydrolase
VKIMVGLGNPGRQYAATRHNLGFMVIDEIARRFASGMSEQRKRFRAELTSVTIDGEKIVLIKPQTYMNLSGSAVREAAHWYKARPDQILVVADDIDLPFGTLRMRASGSSGGHNGFKSVFAELGTQGVPRLRIGVGRGLGEAKRQVLARFTAQEEKILPEIIQAAADCALAWQREGIVFAMNRCNRRILPESEEPIVASADESV